MGSIGSSQPAISTLKELKTQFPDIVSTSGNIYTVQGFGQFRQKKDAFGISTYTKNDDDEWVATSLKKLIKDIDQLRRKR